jgi:hypothetical protein
MNWEAIGVIGVPALVLGFALFAVSRFLINRKLRSARGDARLQQPLQLTKTGWVWLSGTIAILLVGLSAEYLAPDSPIGHLVQTGGGRIAYLALVLVLSYVVELILALGGIRLRKAK